MADQPKGEFSVVEFDKFLAENQGVPTVIYPPTQTYALYVDWFNKNFKQHLKRPLELADLTPEMRKAALTMFGWIQSAPEGGQHEIDS